MNLVGFISTAVLSLTLVAVAPMYAQEQHEQEEQKAKPEEKKAQPEKSAKQEEKPAAQQEKNARQEEKSTKQEEKNAQQQDKNTKNEEKNAQPEKNNKQEEKNAQQQEKNTKQEEKSAQQQQQNTRQANPGKQAQSASGNRGGRIPDDRFRAHFGRGHTFHVSEGDYRNHRFQYGGYWFGFADPWPSNWLYTQDVFVVEIDGVYYLCNAMYPGVNIALSFTL